MQTISSKKSPSTRRIKTVIPILIGLALIGIATYFAVVFFQNKALEDEQNKLQPGASSKQDIIDDKNNSDNNSGAGLPENSTSTTTDQIPSSTELSVSITSISQTGGQVSAAAQTNGNGTCVFLFVPADNGKPVTKQVDTKDDHCSVSISENEFSYLGQWKLTVTYYSDNKKTEASQDVTIR